MSSRSVACAFGRLRLDVLCRADTVTFPDFGATSPGRGVSMGGHLHAPLGQGEPEQLALTDVKHEVRPLRNGVIEFGGRPGNFSPGREIGISQ